MIAAWKIREHLQKIEILTLCFFISQKTTNSKLTEPIGEPAVLFHYSTSDKKVNSLKLEKLKKCHLWTIVWINQIIINLKVFSCILSSAFIWRNRPDAVIILSYLKWALMMGQLSSFLCSCAEGPSETPFVLDHRIQEQVLLGFQNQDERTAADLCCWGVQHPSTAGPKELQLVFGWTFDLMHGREFPVWPWRGKVRCQLKPCIHFLPLILYWVIWAEF